jgi:hypothetical protein
MSGDGGEPFRRLRMLEGRDVQKIVRMIDECDGVHRVSKRAFSL